MKRFSGIKTTKKHPNRAQNNPTHISEGGGGGNPLKGKSPSLPYPGHC